jgi:hypothetical protein
MRAPGMKRIPASFAATWPRTRPAKELAVGDAEGGVAEGSGLRGELLRVGRALEEG